jgi:hypothetical protein
MLQGLAKVLKPRHHGFLAVGYPMSRKFSQSVDLGFEMTLLLTHLKALSMEEAKNGVRRMQFYTKANELILELNQKQKYEDTLKVYDALAAKFFSVLPGTRNHALEAWIHLQKWPVVWEVVRLDAESDKPSSIPYEKVFFQMATKHFLGVDKSSIGAPTDEKLLNLFERYQNFLEENALPAKAGIYSAFFRSMARLPQLSADSRKSLVEIYKQKYIQGKVIDQSNRHELALESLVFCLHRQDFEPSSEDLHLLFELVTRALEKEYVVTGSTVSMLLQAKNAKEDDVLKLWDLSLRLQKNLPLKDGAYNRVFGLFLNKDKFDECWKMYHILQAKGVKIFPLFLLRFLKKCSSLETTWQMLKVIEDQGEHKIKYVLNEHTRAIISARKVKITAMVKSMSVKFTPKPKKESSKI